MAQVYKECNNNCFSFSQGEESKRGKDERYKFSADLLMKKQMDG